MKSTALKAGSLLAAAFLAGAWNSAGAHSINVAGQISLADLHTVSVVFEEELDDTASYGITINGGILVEDYSFVEGGPNLLLVHLDESTPLQATQVYTIQVTDPEGGPIAHFSFQAFSVESEVFNIRASQMPDGGISTNYSGAPVWNPNDPIRVVPYFACISGMGLVFAHRLTGEAALLDDVRSYLDWHSARFEPDGTITDYTGFYPNYNSTGDYDSSDSYGAFYLLLHWLLYQETEDLDYLSDSLPGLLNAAAAIDLTYEPDDLTWAKPTYKIKYTMDNAEVFQGYFAGARLAQVLGEEALYDEWIGRADAVREAIHTHLFVNTPSPGRYAMAMGSSGHIHDGWETYYPDASANEYAIYYTHLPGDAQAQSAWQSHKTRFMAGNVPDPGASWSLAAVAHRMEDRAAFLAAMPRIINNHRQYRYAHTSGGLLELAWLSRETRLRIPATEQSLPVGADFEDDAWRGAGRLRFHRFGGMVGFDNRETYEFPTPNPDPDALHTVYFLQEGSFLHVGLHARDRSITTAGDSGDSDGLSVLSIRDAADPDVIHTITHTFHPDAGAGTIPTPLPGSLFAQGSMAQAAYSFIGAGNTPNDPGDEDEGYFLHLRIPLDHPAAGGLQAGEQHFTFGLRIADMDGTPGESWPWDNGAFGRMMQLSEGLGVASYTVDRAELGEPMPEHNSVGPEMWMILGEAR